MLKFRPRGHTSTFWHSRAASETLRAVLGPHPRDSAGDEETQWACEATAGAQATRLSMLVLGRNYFLLPALGMYLLPDDQTWGQGG